MRTDDSVVDSTAQRMQFEFFANLRDFQPLRPFLEKTPISFARQHLILAVHNLAGGEYLIMGREDAWKHIENFERLLRRELKPALAPAVVGERSNLAMLQAVDQTRQHLGNLFEVCL